MKVMELVNRALKIGKHYRPEPWRLHLIHRRPVVASHSEKQCRKRNSAARIVCHMRKIERQDGSWMIGFLFCFPSPILFLRSNVTACCTEAR